MGFKFKQFAIDDSDCGQKVGTDSIILGSWSEPGSATSILDIGAGSGLLLLMQAQRAKPNTSLVGVELDEGSVIQARHNVERSPWDNIEIICDDINKFHCDYRFDLIIANPPYFVHHKALRELHGTARYNARHSHSLTLCDLIDSVARLLSSNGVFRVVIPVNRRDELLEIAKTHSLYPAKLCAIQTYTTEPEVRTLIELHRSKVDCIKEYLVIYELEQQYTTQFKTLCKEFYLKF